MRALVLAFKNMEDLPPQPERFEQIIAYGVMRKIPKITPLLINLTIRPFQFGYGNHPANERFDYCYIRHPDPFGEPVPWMSAIAGIGESVKGPLEAVFHHPYEVTAFHYLLKKIIGKKNVKWEYGRHIVDTEAPSPPYQWDEYLSRWMLTPRPEKIKSDPNQYVPAFYAELGPILLSRQRWPAALALLKE
ncbi:MAG: hypothetical protein AABX02_00250 [archaeon]